MKILSPTIHGYIDYFYGGLLLLAPTFFDFGGTPAAICYLAGTLQIAASLITRYPMGAVKWLSFPAHGAYELVVSILLVASPWLFAFSAAETPRNLLVVAGLLLLGVYAATDYRRLAVDAVASHDRFSSRPSSTTTFPGSPTRPRDASVKALGLTETQRKAYGLTLRTFRKVRLSLNA